MIPTDNPKIIYGATTLWLPRKFTDWKRDKSHAPVITEGQTYVQVVSVPVRYHIEATTAAFPDAVEDWDGSGARPFTQAWAAFWDNCAKAGKVFSFYRNGADNTPGESYYQYCVWVADSDGMQLLVGNPRYRLNLKLATEGAAR
jgi:hypothetical protein